MARRRGPRAGSGRLPPRAGPSSLSASSPAMDLDGAPQEGNTRSTLAWSTSDDELLKEARISGDSWHQVRMKYFQTRKTSNACRKRHERLMIKALSAGLDGPFMDQLALAYMEKRQEMWSLIADTMNFREWKTLEEKVRSPPPTGYRTEKATD
jgi:hypothetical protein